MTDAMWTGVSFAVLALSFFNVWLSGRNLRDAERNNTEAARLLAQANKIAGDLERG